MRSFPLRRQSRRHFLTTCAAGIAVACSSSQTPHAGSANIFAWGAQGFRDGEFLRPRAIACRDAEVFVIDTTGRVQVFDESGNFLRGWKTPDAENGTPTAVAFGRDGRVLIPDTHYHQILEYARDGELLASWGEFGSGDSSFVYPTGVVQIQDGRYFITEYGDNAERVHVFDADRAYAGEWGSHGSALGELNRAMAITNVADALYVADTTNHRVQVFDYDGALLRHFGAIGSDAGQFRFPFDISDAPDDTLLIAEYGNNRISRYAPDGTFIGEVGTPGRSLGAFNAPRGVAASASGFLFVADTDNHRIQRMPLDRVA